MDAVLVKWNASCIVTFSRTFIFLIQPVSTTSQKEEKTKQSQKKKK